MELPEEIHIPYPSIEQFRNVIQLVQKHSEKNNLPSPVFNYTGTVKLHGTNASVVFEFNPDRVWIQSRNNIITPDGKDNAGFARFVTDKLPVFSSLISAARIIYGKELPPGAQLVIYGEWCGEKIQKNIALYGLPKFFVFFDICIRHSEEQSEWFTPGQIKDSLNASGVQTANEKLIFCIYQFPAWTIKIDFAKPEDAQSELEKLTLQVESECPVGKHFGVSGIGEGIVWAPFHAAIDLPLPAKELTFKTKGPKHCETITPTLVPVKVEQIEHLPRLIETIVTQHRLEKKMEELVERGFEKNAKNTKEFMDIVCRDVLKEEADTIAASGIDQKKVMLAVSKHAREWFVKAVRIV